MQDSEGIKQLFINKFTSVGEDKFYKFLINYATERLASGDHRKHNPAQELLEYYDLFLKMYRKESESVYLDLARQFRKASHKIYRMMVKSKKMDKSKKFLNLL